MEPLISILVGVSFGAAVYCLLHGNLLKLAIGLMMLTHAVNLLLFSAGRMTRAIPPLIPEDAAIIDRPFANPVPEALILTAIVISMGLLIFSVVLVYRAVHQLKLIHLRRGALDPEMEDAA